MASVDNGAVLRQVDRLFRSGTVAGMTEAQLLDRFVARRDEAAFEALLSQHGPTVLGVCRRVLADPNDVDDAFQATFLVLVKKAGTIRDRTLLGNWLYGVAHRVATRARARAARRRSVEGTGVDRVIEIAARPAGSFEIRDLLDEELARLPERDRAAIVLCDLEGCSNDDAARVLGLNAVAFRSRLHRARKRLKDRLARRGLAPGAVLAALPAASVSPTLAEATVAAALRFGAGTPAGLIPAPILALTHEVLRTMMLSKLKFAAATLVAAGLVASGVGVQAQDPAPEKTAPLPDVDRLREVERKLDRVLNALERPARSSDDHPDAPPRAGGTSGMFKSMERFQADPLSPVSPDVARTSRDAKAAGVDQLGRLERRVVELEQWVRRVEQRLDRLDSRGGSDDRREPLPTTAVSPDSLPRSGRSTDVQPTPTPAPRALGGKP